MDPRHPLDRKAGWEKFFASAGDRSPVVQFLMPSLFRYSVLRLCIVFTYLTSSVERDEALGVFSVLFLEFAAEC
jgi:hypothetical protein